MMDYHRQNSVDTRIVRIFNTYGERMLENDGRVVSNFIVQALRGEELTIYGDGTQTRSFCYVSDLVDGLDQADECGGATTFICRSIIGNPGEFTMNELADEVGKATGKEIRDQKYAAAAGRSETAKAKYRAGEKIAWLGAEGAAGRRIEKNRRVFREHVGSALISRTVWQ